MKTWHIGFCLALVALGVVLAVAGAGVFAFLAPLGCAAMMAMMAWMMAPARLKTRVRDWAGGIRGDQAAGH